MTVRVGCAPGLQRAARVMERASWPLTSGSRAKKLVGPSLQRHVPLNSIQSYNTGSLRYRPACLGTHLQTGLESFCDDT